MKAIVAVDRGWGIGNEGQLLFKIKEDMKFFKEMTTGKVVVMGSNTFESIGKELPNRENIILSRYPQKYINMGLTAYTKEGFEFIRNRDDDSLYFIIGGASIYNQFMDKCDTFYVTELDKEFEADAFIDVYKFNTLFKHNRIIQSGEYEGNGWTISEYIRK